MASGAAMWTAWSAPGLSAWPIAIAAIAHARGWRRLRRVEPWRWRVRHLACFLGGLAALSVALWSPLDRMGAWLLSAHMAQHLLLSMVAPPLLLLGWPFEPLMNGLPRWVARDLIGPIIGWPPARNALRRLTHPPIAWALFVAATWAWHFPFAYEWALRSDAAHALEHACFLWSGLLLWWPVVEPWPWKGTWPRWSMAAYLLTADVANTLVAAALAFAPDAVYAPYRGTAPALGVSAIDDQRLAAAIMWLPGSLLFLVPAVVILARALGRRPPARSIALPVLSAPVSRVRFDATRLPLIGAVLRSPTGRLALRLGVLLLAALVVLDGLAGPGDAATSLAGTWPWTHWRGLAAVSVVAAGNLACMGCPLIAPRTVLRRWIRPGLRWPAALRGKWLVATLVAMWLVAYEALAWWNAPALTAWLIIGLVASATLVDLVFEGSAFCQWLCPVGQWNMAMSVASPVQVGVRDAEVCARCTTHDCLRGGPLGPGCGTGLFLPRKVGSLECTACLDCVTACPHGNAGALVRTPFAEVRDEGTRSALGRWTERSDLAALLLVLSAGGLVNALLMTGPASAFVRAALPSWSPTVVAAVATVAGMVALALPALAAAAVGAAARQARFGVALARVAMDLWPLGACAWLVHFGFHLVTGWRSALPPLQRMAGDHGVDLGVPRWTPDCCALTPAWLVPAMLLALAVALALSLQLAWLRARDGRGSAALSFAGTAVAALAWWAIAAWIVLQPMQMRGLIE